MVSLVKVTQGGRVDLTKTNPGVKKFRAGLGWDVNSTDTGTAFDLDVTAFILDEGGKCLTEDYMVFYNNPKDPVEFVKHSGDNQSGAGEGDDEKIFIDISKAPLNAARIAIIVTIHDADVRRQNFGQVKNSYVKIYNDETGDALLEYELGEDASAETAFRFADIYKRGDEWRFEAVGTGQNGGLAAYVREFGLEAA